jgi:hypothetical protein
MKLTLNEVLILSEELNGRVINQQTGEKSKGILSNKLSIKVKYALNNELNRKVAELVKDFEDSRNELIKEYGEEKDGLYSVPQEKVAEFQKDLIELLSIEKDIAVPNINVEELYSIETEDYWPVLLEKLLGKEPELEIV